MGRVEEEMGGGANSKSVSGEERKVGSSVSTKLLSSSPICSSVRPVSIDIELIVNINMVLMRGRG